MNRYSYLYQAPETILSQGSDRSEASDVWSLGTLLYTLSSGRLPFSGIHEIINDPLSWPPTSLRLVDQSFREIVTQMLNKAPASRPSVETILANRWISNSDSSL